MKSKHQNISDFYTKGNLLDFSGEEVAYKTEKDNFDIKGFYNKQSNLNAMSNFLPNFFMNEMFKESEKENSKNHASQNSNYKNNIYEQNFFFQDYDDDSDNDDSQKLIINTITNLDKLDDSNNFGNLNYIDQENNIFADPYESVFSNNFGSEDQGNLSDGNYVFFKNKKKNNPLNNSNSNLQTNFSNTPKNNKISNSFANDFRNNFKENSFDDNNSYLNSNLKYNKNLNFSNDSKFDSNLFNKNFQREFLEMQNNNNIWGNGLNKQALFQSSNPHFKQEDPNGVGKIEINFNNNNNRNISLNNNNFCQADNNNFKNNNNIISDKKSSHDNFIRNETVYNQNNSINKINNFYNNNVNNNYSECLFSGNHINNSSNNKRNSINNLNSHQHQSNFNKVCNGFQDNKNNNIFDDENAKNNNNSNNNIFFYNFLKEENHLKNFIQNTNNINLNMNNFAHISKNFQMENSINPQCYNNNQKINNVPKNINRNMNFVYASDGEFSYHNQGNNCRQPSIYINSKLPFYPGYTSNSNINNFNENCNMPFNNYDLNQFNQKQNPDPKNENINNKKNTVYLNQQNNDFNQSQNMQYFPQKFPYGMINKNYNINYSLNNHNNGFDSENNCKLQHNNIYQLNNFNNNANKALESNSSQNNSNCNLNKNKTGKNKNKKNKNKNKSNKNYANSEKNLTKSFQSMENNANNLTNNSFNNNNMNNTQSFNNKKNNLTSFNQSINKNPNENNAKNFDLNKERKSNQKDFSNISNIFINVGSENTGNLNEVVDSSSCNLEDSMKSLEINSHFGKLNLHGYSSENTDSNSKDNSFSSERFTELNSSRGEKKVVKNTSTNNVNSKKSLFNKEKKEPIKEIKEDLITFLDNINFELAEYICSQKGSRVLQKYLDKISPEAINYIIKMISNNFSKLMMDTYGNYFCQKLIQSCSPEQRIKILNLIANEIVNISHHACGTHALQSFLELINLNEEENIFLNSIAEDVLKMCYDNNATHVIQKILLCITECKRKSMNSIIVNNIKNLVLDSNGICVIKKFINTNKCQISKGQILQTINNNCLEIIQSPFGNYAIQFILENWGYVYCQDLVGIIVNNIISLSMQKFSSNVVEKILDFLNEDIKTKIISDLFNPTKLLGFLKNKYGSFVLQKIIKIMSDKERIEMKNHLASKITATSTKEKNRLNTFLETLYS